MTKQEATNYAIKMMRKKPSMPYAFVVKSDDGYHAKAVHELYKSDKIVIIVNDNIREDWVNSSFFERKRIENKKLLDARAAAANITRYI